MVAGLPKLYPELQSPILSNERMGFLFLIEKCSMPRRNHNFYSTALRLNKGYISKIFGHIINLEMYLNQFGHEKVARRRAGRSEEP